MTAATAALVEIGSRVARFEFNYLAARRIAASRKRPPKAEKLIPEYHSAIQSLDVQGPLIIGGKSMGGRVASMIADELYASGKIVGLLCLGYPFHPPRQAHDSSNKSPRNNSNTHSHLPGHEGRIRKPRGGCGLPLIRSDRNSLARGWRSRSQTAQIRFGVDGIRSSRVDGNGGEAPGQDTLPVQRV
jgi:thioesterase domain-containing protein